LVFRFVGNGLQRKIDSLKGRIHAGCGLPSAFKSLVLLSFQYPIDAPMEVLRQQ